MKSDEIFWTQTLSATGAPVPIDWPRLSGTGSDVGSILSVHWPTTDAAAFLGSPTSFDYQWLRCDASSMGQCSPIAGATDSSYTAVAQDSGACCACGSWHPRPRSSRPLLAETLRRQSVLRRRSTRGVTDSIGGTPTAGFEWWSSAYAGGPSLHVSVAAL